MLNKAIIFSLAHLCIFYSAQAMTLDQLFSSDSNIQQNSQRMLVPERKSAFRIVASNKNISNKNTLFNVLDESTHPLSENSPQQLEFQQKEAAHSSTITENNVIQCTTSADSNPSTKKRPLTLDERKEISRLYSMGQNCYQIGRALGRANTTIRSSIKSYFKKYPEDKEKGIYDVNKSMSLPKGSAPLSLGERKTIALLQNKGKTQAYIAEALNRSKETISRELIRYFCYYNQEKLYDADKAEELAHSIPFNRADFKKLSNNQSNISRLTRSRCQMESEGSESEDNTESTPKRIRKL